MNLGEMIKDYRVNDLGLSREEFAKKAGLTAFAVASIEEGKHVPKISTYRKLSKITGLSIRALMELKTGKARKGGEK